jgi:hypothetical protein
MKSELQGYSSLTQYSADAISLIQQMRSLSPADPMTLVLKQAFANSIKIVWVVMCCLAGLALFASAFIEGYDLNQALATEQGFVDGGKGVMEQVDEELGLAAKDREISA